jgi:hypothetical protein
LLTKTNNIISATRTVKHHDITIGSNTVSSGLLCWLGLRAFTVKQRLSFLKLIEKATNSMTAIANAILKFLISLP